MRACVCALCTRSYAVCFYGRQDAKIRKLEREVKALMATLNGLMGMNTEYRVSQSKVRPIKLDFKCCRIPRGT